MSYFCDEHGKWNCDKWHDPKGPTMCRRCEEEPVYEEGLCYRCGYYD